jgi:hypothetical protein
VRGGPHGAAPILFKNPESPTSVTHPEAQIFDVPTWPDFEINLFVLDIVMALVIAVVKKNVPLLAGFFLQPLRPSHYIWELIFEKRYKRILSPDGVIEIPRGYNNARIHLADKTSAAYKTGLQGELIITIDRGPGCIYVCK